MHQFLFQMQLRRQQFCRHLMQFNFAHNVNNKLASSSASYLRSGDKIRRVFEKTKCEYNVIVSVKKGGIFLSLIAVVENAV